MIFVLANKKFSNLRAKISLHFLSLIKLYIYARYNSQSVANPKKILSVSMKRRHSNLSNCRSANCNGGTDLYSFDGTRENFEPCS